jgi:phosphoadenosine phosphosulfate reductase
MDLNLKKLKLDTEGKDPGEVIKMLCLNHPGQVVFTTSFGLEDQAITHIICTNNLPVEIVTLDTGRMYPETYKTFSATLDRYGCTIKVFHPDGKEVEKLLTTKGPFSFYESVENRKECCRIRKTEPLTRALQDMSVWISGIRASQSDNRSGMESLEYDESRQMLKYYPLFDWSFEEVRNYIDKNNIPYNILHDKGFPSIGCEPCTRAVKPGEDFRAGRWWWESGSAKECGLHSK